MIDHLNTEIPKVMEHKSKLVMALNDLALSITGLTGLVFGFISNHMELLDQMGSIITWFLSTALIIVTGYYYTIKSIRERRALKKSKKKHKDEDKDNKDTKN